MNRSSICRPQLARWAGCAALITALAAPALPTALAADQPAKPAATKDDPNKPPYTVKDGKVDENTYKGYLYYGDQCLRCHGPDASGSSYAPNLTQSLKHMTKEQVENTIINGLKDVNTASQKVMPSFGGNEDVVTNIDNIYAYLKARSDGVLKPGHPERLKS